MGVVHGFSLDRNCDGKISQQEFLKAKKLGLDVSYLDKNDDGIVDKGAKAVGNSVWVDNEQRIYEQADVGNGKHSIMSTSIVTVDGDAIIGDNPNPTLIVNNPDDIFVTDEQMEEFEEPITKPHNYDNSLDYTG